MRDATPEAAPVFDVAELDFAVFDFTAPLFTAGPPEALTGNSVVTRVPGNRVPFAAASNPLRHRAADDTHLAYTGRKRALARFELQNHSSENLVLPDQVLGIAGRDDLQHLRAVEHAGHIGEIDQPVGVNVFGARGGHVIGVNVVEFPVGAQA